MEAEPDVDAVVFGQMPGQVVRSLEGLVAPFSPEFRAVFRATIIAISVTVRQVTRKRCLDGRNTECDAVL